MFVTDLADGYFSELYVIVIIIKCALNASGKHNNILYTYTDKRIYNFDIFVVIYKQCVPFITT